MAVDNDWDLYAVVRSCISVKKSTATKVASPPSISSVSKWLSDSWEPELENQINGPSTEFLKSKADAFQTMEEFYQPFLSNPTVGNYITTPTNTTSTACHVSAGVTVPNSLTSFTFGLGGSSGGAQHQPQQKKNDFDMQPAANINTPHFNAGFIPFSGFERFRDHHQLLLPKLEKLDENGFAIMPTEAVDASPSLVRIPPRLIRPRIRKRPDKKMVCRVTSENLSLDLWRWRKYGTKPIKGSPSPRNYYRCSSSKGCSARKQVERSPDDPDIFIVTFSGDHSHPRPGYFSSLAGSPRDKKSTVTPDTIANNNCVEDMHA